jgi:hypothetical protein
VVVDGTQRAWRCPAPRVLLSVLVLVQLNWSSPSWAWTLEGHRLIAVDALAVLPPPMREALIPHVSAILAGVVAPDFNRVVSHKIQIISLRGTPPPPRSAAAFKRFATNAEEILRLGRDLDDVSFGADPRPDARPRHERGRHAEAVRSRVTAGARARRGSPVGAWAPPTKDNRTLLMRKSLVQPGGAVSHAPRVMWEAPARGCARERPTSDPLQWRADQLSGRER